MPTDLQLQLALAKMLPEKLGYIPGPGNEVYWKQETPEYYPRVKDTEWLAVCHEIEKKLTNQEIKDFYRQMEINVDAMPYSFATYSASWQLRAQALAEVKGITI